MSTSNTPEARLAAFKNKGKDSDSLRRRRNEVTVELRKSKKDDLLSKRRNVDPNVVLSDSESDADASFTAASDLSPSQLQALCQTLLHNKDEQVLLENVRSVRKMLSRERDPPIDAVIGVPGLIQAMGKLLEPGHRSEVQFEAAWAITNVASGSSDQTRAVVEAGLLPPLINLLSSTELAVVEQAVWALGNIAGDGSALRDEVLRQGVLSHITNLINFTDNLAFLRNLAWMMSNLCRNRNPPPATEVVRHLMPGLTFLLRGDDNEIKADICWALSYLTDGPNERIQEVTDTGVVTLLVACLKSNEARVLTPALRAVGNIVTGTDQQTDLVINAGGLNCVKDVLLKYQGNLRKEATWLISNVMAGSAEQIQKAIDCGFLPLIKDVLESGDFKAQKEAVWAVTNLTSGGNDAQILVMAETGVIQPLCRLLGAKDEKLLHVLLDGMTNMFAAAERAGVLSNMCDAIEECDGLDAIEALQHHENEDVYKKALHIVESYFSEDAENVPESVIRGPNGDGNQPFSF